MFMSHICTVYISIIVLLLKQHRKSPNTCGRHGGSSGRMEGGSRQRQRKGQDFFIIIEKWEFFECYARTKRGGLETDYNALLR